MQRVVGIGIDGTNVTIVIGKTNIPCTKASYGDSLDPTYLPSMGSQEQGEKTRGTYKTDTTSITMSTVVFRTLFLPKFPVNGAGNVQFPITVLRVHPDLGSDSDLLERNSIMGLAAAVEQSSKAEEVEIKLSTGQIRWTDARITENVLDGTEQGEASI